MSETSSVMDSNADPNNASLTFTYPFQCPHHAGIDHLLSTFYTTGTPTSPIEPTTPAQPLARARTTPMAGFLASRPLNPRPLSAITSLTALSIGGWFRINACWRGEPLARLASVYVAWRVTSGREVRGTDRIRVRIATMGCGGGDEVA
ncbi:hypothetical protein E1B28_012583 [Marasmius oreades]|uniref:Uncharacterized protein n=1 Tax=Marasmius oreades TaxID=181124 RepID=A0A9P7UQY5_9AGAR|nr:uncharacterized protein E1B28_012583 [Marasmius oreades]KAG7088609.1 hypothetical protein E1B28_012583 [Marasmius oreades]